MEKYNLFLDDIRIPEHVLHYQSGRMYESEPWVIVRSYSEFIACIEERGLPNMVSFDHDLADEHLTPEEYWGDYDKSKAHQESRQPYIEKTGLDCARWLITLCIETRQDLPIYYCHSQNPVGKDNILHLLDNFVKLNKQHIL